MNGSENLVVNKKHVAGSGSLASGGDNIVVKDPTNQFWRNDAEADPSFDSFDFFSSDEWMNMKKDIPELINTKSLEQRTPAKIDKVEAVASFHEATTPILEDKTPVEVNEIDPTPKPSIICNTPQKVIIKSPSEERNSPC